MKKTLSLSFVFMVLMIVLSQPVIADDEVRPTLSISYDIEPKVFMPGDTGTVTVVLENLATSSSVLVQDDSKTSRSFSMDAYVASVTLGDNSNFEVLDTGHQNVGVLGPKDTLRLTFNIKAKENIGKGTHFLRLRLIGGSSMYDLNYKIPIKVDERELGILLSDVPPTLMNEVTAIGVELVNRRPNDVTGIIVVPHGEGMSFTPSEYFIGNISSGEKATASFILNTMHCEREKKEISFTASYFNGDNMHQTPVVSRVLDISGRSSLIITALKVNGGGDSYTISGVLNNFGTTPARNVMVSVEDSENVQPSQPNGRYYISTLKTDDFSSFELSAQVKSPDITAIPIIIEFRDPANAYISIREEIPLDKGTSVMAPGTSTTLNPPKKSTPVLLWLVAGLVTIGVGALVYNSWKKRRIDGPTTQASEDDDEELYDEVHGH